MRTAENLMYYVSPCIKNRIELACRQPLLAASIAASATVETAGHNIQEETSFDQEFFNHVWE